MKERRAGGFTVLEVLLATLILSTIAATIWAPRLVSEAQELRLQIADLLVEEIHVLSNAARRHATRNSGEWPGQQDDGCPSDSAWAALSPEVPGLDRNSPLLRLGTSTKANGETQTTTLGIYEFRCDDNDFVIDASAHSDDIDLLDYAASQFARANVQFVDGADRMRVPVASSTALPELEELDDVQLKTGQSLGSAVTFAGVFDPGNEIEKPECPAELGYVPQIVTVPVQMSHSEGFPMVEFRVWAEDLAATPTTPARWRLRSHVVTSANDGSPEPDNDDVRIAAFVKCS